MDILAAIKDVGFPIAVAAFVLIRLNGKMDKLTTALVGLASTMDRYIIHAEDEMKTTTLRDDQRTQGAMQRILDALDRRP